MPSLHTLMTFTVVSFGLALIPGPSTFFLVSQGALHGRARALLLVAGFEIASAIRVLATAVGLSALLASSATAFTLIRWVGVAYLAWLGLRAALAIRTDQQPTSARTPPATGNSIRAVGKGVIVALSNVKMAIFYLAFFPQFVHADRGSHVEQILILGTVFWVIGLAGDLVYALSSSTLGRRLGHRSRLRGVRAPTEAVSYLALAALMAAHL